MTDVFFFFSHYMFFLLSMKLPWILGKRTFSSFYRNLFSVYENGLMDCMSSLYFNADPILSVFLIKRLLFFAIIFGCVAPLWWIPAKKTFFIVGEEEYFLDSPFLFEDEALFKSLLTFSFKCILLDLDFIYHAVFLKCNDQLGTGGWMKTGLFMWLADIFSG